MIDDFSKHQQKIIKNYYQNIDKISLQKLSELVTELFLSEGKKRQTLWKTAIAAMKKIGLPQSRIDHLVEKNDPALLAKLVQELHGST